MTNELTKAMSLLFMLAAVVVFGSITTTTTTALAATKEMEATTPTQEQFAPTKALIAESLAQIDSAIASVVELVSIQGTEVATAVEIEAEKITPTIETQLSGRVNQTIVEDAILEEIIEDTGIAEEVIPGISIVIDDAISGDITPAEASTEIIEIVQQAANSTEITVGHVMQASDDPTVITEQILEDR